MSSHWSTYMVPLDRLGISSFFGSFLLLQYLCFNISVDGMMHIHFWGCFRAEQTFEYTPPEALLNASWYHGPKGTTVKYVNLRYKSIWKLACMVYILRIYYFFTMLRMHLHMLDLFYLDFRTNNHLYLTGMICGVLALWC